MFTFALESSCVCASLSFRFVRSIEATTTLIKKLSLCCELFDRSALEFLSFFMQQQQQKA